LRIDDRTSRGATLIPILITTLTHFVLGGRLGTNFSVPPDKAIAIDQITVRDGKLQKDRVTMLAGHGQAAADRTPETSLANPWAGPHLGFDPVCLPDASARKYPDREWGWRYVFPAANLSVDPCSGVKRRHHLDESVIQRAVKAAPRQAGLKKPATPIC
jgi:hypothetical protein